jgi:hypothetical protein
MSVISHLCGGYNNEQPSISNSYAVMANFRAVGFDWQVLPGAKSDVMKLAGIDVARGSWKSPNRIEIDHHDL